MTVPWYQAHTHLQVRLELLQIHFVRKGRQGKNDDIGIGRNGWIIRALRRLTKTIRTQIIHTANALVSNVRRKSFRFAGKEGKDGGLAVVEGRHVGREHVNGIAAAAEKNLHNRVGVVGGMVPIGFVNMVEQVDFGSLAGL